MNRIAAVLALVLLAWPQVGSAAPRRPSAMFASLTPTEAIDRIAAACDARGFGVRRMSEADVICQGGELVRDDVVFRPSGPAADPMLKPQEYHRFTAVAAAPGAVVQARTTMTMYVAGRMIEVDPAGFGSRMVNARLTEFYAALGAVIQP